jgi:integrase/recombinase XerD
VSVSSFQSLMQRFFTDRLLKQLGASQYTVAAYRDAFRLLLQFASARLGRPPSELLMEDRDVPFLGQFLEHLEVDRGNCTRTRNNRLAAIHAFFQYVAVSEPAFSLQCQRVLAIPAKRYTRGPVGFLTEEETAQRKRPPPLWPHLILTPGSEGGIRRFCSSPFRRDSGIVRLHHFADRT